MSKLEEYLRVVDNPEYLEEFQKMRYALSRFSSIKEIAETWQKITQGGVSDAFFTILIKCEASQNELS